MEKKTKVIIGIVVAVITVIIVAGLLIVQAIFTNLDNGLHVVRFCFQKSSLFTCK